MRLVLLLALALMGCEKLPVAKIKLCTKCVECSDCSNTKLQLKITEERLERCKTYVSDDEETDYDDFDVLKFCKENKGKLIIVEDPWEEIITYECEVQF